MGFAGTDDVVKTAIEAMTEMAEEYSCSNKWTWGYVAPWHAPEYIYTTAIARALAKPAKRGVYLECGIKNMVKDAIQTAKGRPAEYPEKSRCDMLVADGKTNVPRICLEVKTNPNIISDVKRCMKIVSIKGKSKLRDAAVIFMDHASKEKTLRNRYDHRVTMLENCNKDGGSKNNLVALSKKGGIVKKFDTFKIYEHEYGYWYVSAVKISGYGK